jgi:hypothetical protein
MFGNPVVMDDRGARVRDGPAHHAGELVGGVVSHTNDKAIFLIGWWEWVLSKK